HVGHEYPSVGGNGDGIAISPRRYGDAAEPAQAWRVHLLNGKNLDGFAVAVIDDVQVCIAIGGLVQGNAMGGKGLCRDWCGAVGRGTGVAPARVNGLLAAAMDFNRVNAAL